MLDLGDRFSGCTISAAFTTVASTGAPSGISGNPAPTLAAWKLPGFTCSTAGITLSLDCKGVTGWNGFAVNTNADAAFYSCGYDYALYLTGGVVNSVCVQGYTVATFSLKNRAGLQPTISGRQHVDVSTGGTVGLDWTNIDGPNTAQRFSCTSIFDVTSVCNSVVAVASNYSEQAVACTVWNSLQANYDVCGSFGVLLDSTITSRLAPTTAGRTLDVSAGGAAGVDWANVESSNTSNFLSCTSFYGAATICNTSFLLCATTYRVETLSNTAVSSIVDAPLTEPASVFAWAGATIRNVLAWTGAMSSNAVAQSNTQQGLCTRAAAARIAVAAIDCTADVVTRGSFV